jgi:hypothetical protein
VHSFSQRIPAQRNHCIAAFGLDSQKLHTPFRTQFAEFGCDEGRAVVRLEDERRALSLEVIVMDVEA